MNRNMLLGMVVFVCCLAQALDGAAAGTAGSTRPNIMWISSEDHGPQMGCYGDALAVTPNVDGLASRGVRYATCWSNAPVCAPARTTIITGMYPPSLGAEHMRSMVAMPEGTRLFPSILREQGYYCTNNSKEDYNVDVSEKVWDVSSNKAHWKNRPDADQPFFAVFNSTLSHESAIRRFQGEPKHDVTKVRVPAYHPDTPTSRRDWAIYYDTVTQADEAAGKHLKELEAAGLAESTIVFYWGDHGSGMPRSKRWPCNSGLHVPLVVYIPEAFAHLRPYDYKAGGVCERPVSFVDFAPTMLSLAGIPPKTWMQGKAFLGPYADAAQKYVYGFRGRMDERLDLVRSVTDGQFVYVRNYMPHRSQAQHVAYQFETPTTAEWRTLYEAGKTNEAQSAFWKTPKACEELYDLTNDPDEVNNLVGVDGYLEKLDELRVRQQIKAREINDLGFMPEGMRFELAGDAAFYDWAREPGNYPFWEIFLAAERASRVEQFNAEQMLDFAKSGNSEVRYWGIMGLLMRGESAVKNHMGVLTKALDDDSEYVAISAARALATYGDAGNQKLAIEFLLTKANWKDNDVFVSMLALDALNSVHGQLGNVSKQIDSLSVKGDSPNSRYNSYVPRLLESLKAGLY
jgi:arylsulfatase A-like enzyme